MPSLRSRACFIVSGDPASAFGHWVTNSDPAFLRILAKSERYKLRYDAAKQQVPRVEVV